MCCFRATADPWRCGNGVVFNLSKPWLPQRTMGWTSGDAGAAAAAAPRAYSSSAALCLSWSHRRAVGWRCWG